jgi:hypothetical protein
LKALRRLIQRAPFYSALKTLGHYPDYWYWNLRGRPIRSPHLLKQRTVMDYGERFGLRTLVETGTYRGEMVAAMKSRFERIFSIEQDPALAETAARKFARYPHIQIMRGDSHLILPELVKSLAAPALFWLDAGYYGWAGIHGDTRRLGVELGAILGQRELGHVILMDDARGLNGENGAPALAGVIYQIGSRFPNRKVEVAYDILRITPDKKN